MWGGFDIVLLLLPTAPLSIGQEVWVFRSLSGAQDYRFFLVQFQIRPADSLLSPEPGGGQGIVFARTVKQGYTGLCLLHFVCCIRSTFWLNNKHFFLSRGCR